MTEQLKGKRVAILATEGFEYAELVEPRKGLDEAGAKTEVISPRDKEIRGWDKTDWGKSVKVDVRLASAKPESYDALLLPGGVMNPDKLRTDPTAVAFVKSFIEAKKPVAAICHGPWMLVEADVLKGRTITSWPSLRTDISNAGGRWVDQEVTTDQGLGREPETGRYSCLYA